LVSAWVVGRQGMIGILICFSSYGTSLGGLGSTATYPNDRVRPEAGVGEPISANMDLRAAALASGGRTHTVTLRFNPPSGSIRIRAGPSALPMKGGAQEASVGCCSTHLLCVSPIHVTTAWLETSQNCIIALVGVRCGVEDCI
jgi:hypothetical protein